MIRSFFQPQSSAVTGVDHLLRQQLLWMLLLRVVLYTLLLGVTFLLSELDFAFIVLPNQILIFLLLTVYSISVISAVILNRSGAKLHRFGFIQSIFDTLFASTLVYFSGISSSIFTSVYFFSIITGGLILPRRGGLIAAAAATLTYGILLYIEYIGLIPSHFYRFDYSSAVRAPELINLFAVKGLTFFLAAVLSALFGMRLTSTEEVLSNTLYSFDKLSYLYKTIFDNISTGIITTNDQNIISSANNAVLFITGYTHHDLIGRELGSLFPTIDLTSRVTRQAIDFHKKDGTKIRIGYSLTSLNIPEKTNSTSSGIESLYEEDSKLVTLQDISEVEKLERKIRQGEKMAAIGMMSAGIAHDFRNPLTAISGSAQVLAKEFTPPHSASNPENLALTNIILRESHRLISTISDFLKFARPDIARRQWFSLLNCLEEVLQVFEADPDWPSSCTITLRVGAQTDIWADEKQFFIVMSHLVENAIAFCPEGNEQIVITAFEKNFPDNKEKLLITIEDNGPGIAQEQYEKVFEPFYTKRADGTGLGLAIVKQTLEGHKGSVEIAQSSLGGAKFILTMPIF